MGPVKHRDFAQNKTRNSLSYGAVLGLCLSVQVSLADEIILAKQYSQERGNQEDIQWTAESITIIDKTEIEATYRRDLQDLSRIVPGMVFDSSGSSPQGGAISIRGNQSGRANAGIEPAVAVSVDGVYIGSHASQNQVLFDFERVEIARGPQGTFSGAPAVAGSINIRRTQPTGKFDLETSVEFGDINPTRVDAVLNFPVTNKIAAKISARVSDNENFGISNLNVNKLENRIQESTLAVSILWQATDNLSAQYTFDYEKDDSDTPALVNLSTTADLICNPGAVVDPTDLANCGRDGRVPETSSNRTLQNFSNDRRYDGLHHTFKIESHWNDLDITSITGFRNTEEESSGDLDATFVDRYSSITKRDYDQFSTDLKVRGNMNEETNFVVGAYWLEADSDLDQEDRFILDTLIAGGRLAPTTTPNQTLFTESNQESTTLSLFGYVNHKIDDLWSSDLGIRFNGYKKDFDHKIKYDNNLISINNNDDWSQLSANSSISYNVVDEDAMIYLRVGLAYAPGGYFDRAVSPESAPYRNSQRTRNIELGMKSEWLNNRLRLNMAFYKNYQDDVVEEFTALSSLGNLEATLGNIADIEARGFDLEFEYAVLQNLYIRGAYSHMNATYKRYDVPDIARRLADPQVEDSRFDPFATLSLAGLTPRRAPDDTYFISAKYTIPFRNGLINMYAAYNRVASYQTNPLIPSANVRLHSRWDASIDYQLNSLTIRLFGQNLIDDRYLLNYQNSYDAQILSIAGQTATQGIVTSAERNRPQYIGLDFIWTPNLDFIQSRFE
ncbi:MAG: iron complex outermembrane receptor protein [Candidatus Azotimanducaceae bacterium]|jgi:iron complex outermembrane receptor protein